MLQNIQLTKDQWKRYNHLSDNKTKCWLSGSKSAFAKSLFSASTIEISPQATWILFANSFKSATISYLKAINIWS